MKFSLKWLNDFVSVEDFLSHPEPLTEKLTQAGLELESIENLSKQLDKVVVAKILSVEKHPNADRLTLCKVSTGEKTFSIVCGAKNHKEGDKVALALDGAVLPQDFKIKKTKVRGQESEGMLASASELGLETQQNKDAGILILDSKAKVGESFASHYGLDDVIIDLNVTPNRADVLSHIGLAREVSCLFGREFSTVERKLKTDKNISTHKKVRVQVQDSKRCPRYSGRYIEGVTIQDSPEWLKKRLKSIGLKSINNIVDVTNYILWDRGQPLHAFDADKISNIIVGSSQKGETFVSLDDEKLTLTGQELVIRDDQQVLALAGVIGGKDSGISLKTKNVFIEAAYFRPEEVRKSSRKFGIQTDSSYRFSRGTDSSSVVESLDLACALIQELAGGVASADHYDFYTEDNKTKPISITLEDLSQRLGYEVSKEAFVKWMKQLKLEIKTDDKDVFEITPPSFRNDLHIKEDLIEEFARLEGYDHIPDSKPPRAPKIQAWDSTFERQQELQSFMKNKGCYQVINYSFSDPNFYNEFLNSHEDLKSLALPAIEAFSVQNPISKNLSLMKNFLSPDLVKNVHYNLRHGNKWGRIFEVSPVFYKESEERKDSENSKEHKDNKDSKNNKTKQEYKQHWHLALAQWGSASHLWESKSSQNIFYIKSLMESFLKQQSYNGFQWKQVSISVPFVHPQQVLILEIHKKPIGYLASLHPSFQAKHKIKSDVVLAEFNLSELWNLPQKKLKFKKPSSFLSVEKDLTFEIPQDVQAGEVQKEIKKALGSACDKVDVIDLFEKEKMRFISFRLYLTPEKQAWLDEDLQEFQNTVIEHIKNKFSISLKN